MNDSFDSWLAAFAAASPGGDLPPQATFYEDLIAFLASPEGRRYFSDIAFVDDTDPTQGIESTRISFNWVDVEVRVAATARASAHLSGDRASSVAVLRNAAHLQACRRCGAPAPQLCHFRTLGSHRLLACRTPAWRLASSCYHPWYVSGAQTRAQYLPFQASVTGSAAASSASAARCVQKQVDKVDAMRETRDVVDSIPAPLGTNAFAFGSEFLQVRSSFAAGQPRPRGHRARLTQGAAELKSLHSCTSAALATVPVRHAVSCGAPLHRPASTCAHAR